MRPILRKSLSVFLMAVMAIATLSTSPLDASAASGSPDGFQAGVYDAEAGLGSGGGVDTDADAGGAGAGAGDGTDDGGAGTGAGDGTDADGTGAGAGAGDGTDADGTSAGAGAGDGDGDGTDADGAGDEDGTDADGAAGDDADVDGAVSDGDDDGAGDGPAALAPLNDGEEADPLAEGLSGMAITPGKPTGLKAVSAGYNKIALSWDEAIDADGYEVRRSASKTGTYKVVASLENDGSIIDDEGKASFTDTGLTTGKAYYYKVRAYADPEEGEDGGRSYSAYSSIVNKKPTPAKVDSPKAANAGYNAIKVSWGKVSGASGYQVYRSTSKSGTYKKTGTVTSGSTVSFTNKSLATGKAYYYKIRAYRTVSGQKIYGSYSTVVNAKPQLAATKNAKAKSAGYNSIKVSWSKTSGASGYEIFRSAEEDGTYKKAGTVKKGSTVSFTNKSLKTEKDYYYKVRAYRTVSGKNVPGAFSGIVTAKPLLAKTGGAKAASAGYSSVKVSWGKVSGASGYEVYQADEDGEPVVCVKRVKGGTTLAYTDKGLEFNEKHYYRVRAYRTVGDDEFYGPYSAKVSAKPALPKIGGAKAAAPSHKSTKISWNKVSGASGYEVYRATSSGGAYTLKKTITSGSTLSFSDTGLTTGATYYYKVRPYRFDSESNKVRGGFSPVLKATPQYGTVYWVPNGVVFHVDRNCSTLSRSKTILSGSVAQSGKPRVCKVCGG
ncbi:MAG: hypothetical protein FWG03_03600 [Clostridiales bacterium]|nr:hypothetical protein [Clostridiales bacterium]